MCSSTEEFTLPSLQILFTIRHRKTLLHKALPFCHFYYYLSLCCSLHWLSAEKGCKKADFLVKSVQMNVNDIDLNPHHSAHPPLLSSPLRLPSSPSSVLRAPMLSSSLLLLVETSGAVTGATVTAGCGREQERTLAHSLCLMSIYGRIFFFKGVISVSLLRSLSHFSFAFLSFSVYIFSF